MPYLKMPNTTPPGGWRYFQPETRLWFNGDDQGYEDMVERIAHHRQYRKIQRQSLKETAEDVQNQICERLGPEHCRDMPSGSFWLKNDYSAGLSASSVLAGSKAFIDFLTEGTEQVPLEQVKQRAEICRGCHLNTPLQGCGSCSTLMQMTAKILPKERRLEGLQTCAACGCGLQLKVNATMETISKADEGRNLTYPTHCWVTKESELK